jgi:phage baseplate assembly protein gpV
VALSASSDTGRLDLPVPAPGADSSISDAALLPLGTRESLAVIGFMLGSPVCLGFLPPMRSQMFLTDANRRIDRHASDVYTTIDAEGNTELYHPSGTYLRIGTAPAHENLTPKSFEGDWAITKNTDKAVHVHLTVANAGAVKATINIDPSGNVSVDTVGTLALSSDGDMSITAPNLSINANIATTGALTNNGVNISSTHVHGGVQSGGSNTGTPV